ncbi:MAG: FtsQ-type POTRA domain-containing protein, partial [Terracoccus sp.]
MSVKEATRTAAGRTGLSSARSRFERRAAAARRRPALLWGSAVGLLLVAGLVAWLGWFSSVMPASDVTVEGATGAGATQVRSVAKVPLGGALLRVDTDAVAGRILADRRWKNVSVSRSLPHTVVIRVTPRVAALGIRRTASTIDLVDADGLAFRTVNKAPAGVPVVQAGGAKVSPTGVQAALEAL